MKGVKIIAYNDRGLAALKQGLDETAGKLNEKAFNRMFVLETSGDTAVFRFKTLRVQEMIGVDVLLARLSRIMKDNGAVSVADFDIMEVEE